MFSHTLSKILYDKGLKTQGNAWWNSTCPAFNFLDLLNRENAVKLWGEMRPLCNQSCKIYDEVDPTSLGHKHYGWRYRVHELLDLYLSGGEQAVEARLVVVLTPSGSSRV